MTDKDFGNSTSSFVSLPDLIGQSREKDMYSPIKHALDSDRGSGNDSFYFYALRSG